jgi:hypothetical protein
MNAIRERERIEYEQQSAAASAQTQVDQQLCLMQWRDLLDGFHFQNIRLADQIGSLAAIERNTVICQRQIHLPRVTEPRLVKLIAQAPLVCALQQARTNQRMHPHRQADNLMGEIVDSTAARAPKHERYWFKSVNPNSGCNRRL